MFLLADVVCCLSAWAMEAGPAQFYGLTVAAMGLRCLKYLVQRRDLYTSTKWTCPHAYVPTWLLKLCGERLAFLGLLPMMLAYFTIAALRADLWAARLAAAAAYTLFSMGCAFALEWGHGQYPVLYSAWALALLPTPWAVAASRAAGVYLYVCAGLTKLSVPAKPSDFFDPKTMRTLMSADGKSPRFEVAWPWLAAAFRRSDFLLRCVSWGTLCLELVLVPATFVLPVEGCRWVALLCVAFHGGIWLVLSNTAGTMFYQLAGVYAFGFCGELAVGSAEWACGLLLAASPLLKYLWVGDPYVAGEKWPTTNCALFPWSHVQYDFINKHLLKGTTRLVLTSGAATSDDLIGKPVIGRGQPKHPSARSLLAHNAIGNLWNYTKVYPEFVKALNAACAADDASALVGPTTAWLQAERPLSETLSRRTFTHAYLVEVDGAGLVRRVLAPAAGKAGGARSPSRSPARSPTKSPTKSPARGASPAARKRRQTKSPARK